MEIVYIIHNDLLLFLGNDPRRRWSSLLNLGQSCLNPKTQFFVHWLFELLFSEGVCIFLNVWFKTPVFSCSCSLWLNIFDRFIKWPMRARLYLKARVFDENTGTYYLGMSPSRARHILVLLNLENRYKVQLKYAKTLLPYRWIFLFHS